MEISCPISAERINENVVRLIAFFVVLIATFSVLYLNYYAIVFLAIDFATRAFTSGKFSLLRFFAIRITKQFNVPIKLTDLAPKKFAATLGFVFCILIAISYLLGLLYIAAALTLLMIVFAILESVFAICVGCHVYSIWQKISRK